MSVGVALAVSLLFDGVAVLVLSHNCLFPGTLLKRTYELKINLKFERNHKNKETHYGATILHAETKEGGKSKKRD